MSLSLFFFLFDSSKMMVRHHRMFSIFCILWLPEGVHMTIKLTIQHNLLYKRDTGFEKKSNKVGQRQTSHVLQLKNGLQGHSNRYFTFGSSQTNSQRLDDAFRIQIHVMNQGSQQLLDFYYLSLKFDINFVWSYFAFSMFFIIKIINIQSPRFFSILT